VRPDGTHVGVVPLPLLRLGGPVTVGQQERRDVGDEGEAEHRDGAADPAELRHAPRERQHAAPDHGRDDVGDARPHVAWSGTEQRRRDQRGRRSRGGHGCWQRSGTTADVTVSVCASAATRQRELGSSSSTGARGVAVVVELGRCGELQGQGLLPAMRHWPPVSWAFGDDCSARERGPS
jgi:hypothetical protein